MTQPDEEFTRIFSTLTSRHVDTLTFRQLIRAGEPLASANAARQDAKFVSDILTDPEYDKYFLDRKAAVDFFGGAEAFQRSLTENKLATYRRIADTAAIVLMHTATDAAITDCCRLSAAVAPTDWEPFLGAKQVTLSSLKAATYAELLRMKLDAHLDALERDSILKRADVMLQICRPEPGYDPIGSYRYDRGKLERLDRLRQDLVHGNNEDDPLGDVSEAIEFLVKTGMFIWGLLNMKYGLHIDPTWILRTKAPQAPSPKA